MKRTGLQCNSDVVCSKAVVKMFLSELGVINPFLITFALQSLFSPQGTSRSAPLSSISCHIFTRHTGARWVGPWFLLPAQVKQHQAAAQLFMWYGDMNAGPHVHTARALIQWAKRPFLHTFLLAGKSVSVGNWGWETHPGMLPEGIKFLSVSAADLPNRQIWRKQRQICGFQGWGAGVAWRETEWII